MGFDFLLLVRTRSAHPGWFMKSSAFWGGTVPPNRGVFARFMTEDC